jgi:hypothetical protein
MEFCMKSLVCLSVLAALSVSAAHAQEASPLTANVSLTSKYKYRGQDQGSLKYFAPAIQGGFDYSKNGFYVGNWNSSVGFGGGTEIDLYGGYKGQITKDLGFDVGALQYWYRDTSFNTTELYAAISFAFLSLKYSGTVSNDYFGAGKIAFDTAAGTATPLASTPKGRGTGYLDLSANYEVVKGVTLNGHVGYTRLSSDLRDVGSKSFVDYKLGATYDLGNGFSAAGAFVGANKRAAYGDLNKGRVIVTVTKAM